MFHVYTETFSLAVGQQTHDVVWSHDSQRLYFLAVDNAAFEFDLAALRRELAVLGLDW
jgi:hypothetical protein